MENNKVKLITPQQFIQGMEDQGFDKDRVITILCRAVDMLEPIFAAGKAVYPYIVTNDPDGFKIETLSKDTPENNPKVDNAYVSLYDVARLLSH